MSPRTAALALTLSLASAPMALAQSTPAPAAGDVPPPKLMTDMMSERMLPLREVAAIGTGVVVGAALFHVALGHGLMIVGAAVGGWIGDWYYGSYPAPVPGKS
jgi:hypothetical protein